MEILVVGLNHKTAPLEVRERLHFPEDRLNGALERLSDLEGITEGMILSTCNRIEVYARTPHPEESLPVVDRFLGEFHALPLDAYGGFLYRHLRRDAVRHLFRVTASLDSMVVGEPQITGQVKTAYQAAIEQGAAGPGIRQVMDRALGAAKKVRTETAVAASAVSVSYAAVELARRIFGDLHDHRVMLVGAAEMGQLAARHLVSHGARHVMVANRSYEKAVAVAREFEGTPVPLRHLEEHLAGVDVLISCTASPEPILTRDEVARAMRRRRHRPMFLVDIAVPRDIEATIHGLPNVYLYNIDDLQQVVEENLKARRGEAARAEAIVESEVESFTRWLRQKEVGPTIQALRDRMESIRAAEIDRIDSRLEGLSPDQRRAVDEATRRLVNKILHRPLKGIKEVLDQPDGLARVEAIRKLFGIEER